MKRLIAWMLALVMIFSLTACGSSGNEPASADPASESSTAAKTETKDAEPASSVPGSAAEPTASPTTAEETAAPTTEEETTEPVPETEVWNENEEFTNNYENIVLLEAERQAELAALEELRKDPVHHAENELFTVDVVKVVSRWNSYEITYIATNVSDSTLYIKGQDERWEDSGWTPSGAYGPGESFKESDNFVDEDVYKTKFVSFLYSNVILAETDTGSSSAA